MYHGNRMDEDLRQADADLALLEHGSRAQLDQRLPDFDHRAHLRVAWRLCQLEPLPSALARISAGLRRATALVGARDKYHETLTWAWMMLVAEREAEAEPGQSFAAFEAQNPDLFRGRTALDRRYDRATLDSARARARFVLPTLPDPAGVPHGA